jgi:hypothetical protein
MGLPCAAALSGSRPNSPALPTALALLQDPSNQNAGLFFKKKNATTTTFQKTQF